MTRTRLLALSFTVASTLAGLFVSACAVDTADGTAGGEPVSEGSSNLRKGVMVTPRGEFEITYEVRDGKAFYQGDILLGTEEEASEQFPGPGSKPQSTIAANGSRRFELGKLWPSYTIPYRFASGIPQATKDGIAAAINHYHERTSLFFYEDKQNAASDYVRFDSSDPGCSSWVGKTGGSQVINLGTGCEAMGTAAHEIGHAVGLFHEQSRPDRDQFVTINWGNITVNKEHNFFLESASEGVGTYDFDSLMHYDSYAFSKNGLPTITRKDGSIINAQRNGLSDGDVRGIQVMYGASYEPVAAVASADPGFLNVFIRGSDGNLWHKAWGGDGWYPSAEGFDNLGGPIVGAPAAVGWGQGNLDMFVRGFDGHMYHKAYRSWGWYPSMTGFNSLGGTFTGQPAAVAFDSGRLDIFGRGPNGDLLHRAYTGTVWEPANSWESLGGNLAGPVKAVSWGPNRIDLFAVGADSAIWHKSWNGTSWYPSKTTWSNMGGQVAGAPSVTSWGSNRLDIVVKGTDGGVYHKAWTGTVWYPSQTGWSNMGGTPMSPPAIVSTGFNKLDIFIQSSSGTVQRRAYNGSSWSGWDNLGGNIVGSPVPISWGPGRFDLFVRGTDNGLWHKMHSTSTGYYPAGTVWGDLKGQLAW